MKSKTITKIMGTMISLFVLFAVSLLSSMLIGSFIVNQGADLIIPGINMHVYTFLSMFGIGVISFSVGLLMNRLVSYSSIAKVSPN